MKKLTSVISLASLTLAVGVFSGCSSSPKAEETMLESEAPLASAPIEESLEQPEQIDSLNLGASSAGRAH